MTYIADEIHFLRKKLFLEIITQAKKRESI